MGVISWRDASMDILKTNSHTHILHDCILAFGPSCPNTAVTPIKYIALLYSYIHHVMFMYAFHNQVLCYCWQRHFTTTSSLPLTLVCFCLHPPDSALRATTLQEQRSPPGEKFPPIITKKFSSQGREKTRPKNIQKILFSIPPPEFVCERIPFLVQEESPSLKRNSPFRPLEIGPKTPEKESQKSSSKHPFLGSNWQVSGRVSQFLMQQISS